MRKYLALLLILPFAFAACKSSKAPAVEENLTPHELIRANRIEEARQQFMSPYDINDVDEDGNTVLHLAAKLNDRELAEWFIFKGANVNAVNGINNTPLHTAILEDSFDVAELLTKKGSDVFAIGCKEIKESSKDNPEEKVTINRIYKSALEFGLESEYNKSRYEDLFITPEIGSRTNEEGQNLVHYFVRKKNARAVGICIRNGLPISAKDNNGKTPLDLAFENITDDTSVNIAALLILADADEVETDFAYFQEAVSSRNMDKRFDDNQTPLHMAASMGHTAIAKYLISNGASPDLKDSSGSTPLHEAVRYGKVDIMKLLLDAKADVNAQNNLGKTPIMVVMPPEQMQEIYKVLVSYNANLNIKDSFGDTLLHTATMMHASSNILGLLVDSGADVNGKNKEGVTPFEIAIQHHDKEMTRFYANHDADIHTKDTNGISPLSLALEADRDLFEMTVSKKNVQSQDSEGNTPLHIALLKNAPLEKILYIISLTDDVNIRNSDGNNVLYIACENKQEQVVKSLLEKGADIFSTNKDNVSALRLALRDGGVVQDWIVTSKTIKAKDGAGKTCLHYAAEWGYKDSIYSLVERGADPYARTEKGESILFSAVTTNNPEIIDTVIAVGCPVNQRDNLGNTPLHYAVSWDATKSITKLLSMGIDIDAQNSSGKSALAVAAFSGKLKTAKVLLNNNADVNTSDSTGGTILMDAIRGQNRSLVKLLLDYNANASIQDINGVNAYHVAAETGNTEIIKMIRDAGGNPLSRDKNGRTPFSIVMKRDMKTIKAVLGSNINITDSDGNTPIHLVVKARGSDALLMELINMGYPIDGRNSDGYTALTYAVEANDVNTALSLLKNKANPFQSINKKQQNAVTIALEKNNKQMIANIVNYAGKKTDIQGNTILHYAARLSNADVVKELLAFGLPKDIKNISGETPYTIATRWKNKDVAELLK